MSDFIKVICGGFCNTTNPEDVYICLDNYLHENSNSEGKIKYKNTDILYFFKNIKRIFGKDELVLKLNYDDKEIMNQHYKYHVGEFTSWLLNTTHSISNKVCENKWNVNVVSSYVPQRNGDIWIDYKFGTYHTRVFLYLKKYNKNKFKKYPDKNYMLIVKDLNERLDVLYFNTNSEVLLKNKNLIKNKNKNKNKKPDTLFKLNKPLFSGETYNKVYCEYKYKSTNPFDYD